MKLRSGGKMENSIELAGVMETSEMRNEKQEPIFRDIRRYYCEHCGICRSKKSLIRSHILLHHKGELEKVKLDEVSAPKVVRRKVEHICQVCSAIFWKPAHLIQHMRSHSVQRLFSCPLEDCDSYRRKDHLNRHLLKHQGKVFDCPNENCSVTFSMQSSMRRHVKQCHEKSGRECVDESPSQGEKKYACKEPSCGATFKFPSRLMKHENSHVKLNFVELYCGEPGCLKPFTNADCLKAHVQSCHKYIKCDVCGTQQHKKCFREHQRTHEGFSGEQVKCCFEGCEQTFTKKSNLNKHVKAVHEQIRPFCCRASGCQMKFSYKHVRDNHEATHEYKQGDFLEADEQRSSRVKGGRKKRKITVETLMTKRVVPVGHSSVFADGAHYLSWLLSEDE